MTTHYRQNTWTLREARSTFMRQMADHARGETLRQLRSQRGLSQEDVAGALGVTSKTYGDWERGGGIHPANVKKVARYFKVKPGTLINPTIPPEATTTNGSLPHQMQDQLDRIEKTVEEILKRLSEPDEGEGGAPIPKTPPPLPKAPPTPPGEAEPRRRQAKRRRAS